MDPKIDQKWENVKQKTQPLFDFNMRGQLLILLLITFTILVLRLLLFVFSGFDLMSFVPPDYFSIEYMDYVNEGSIYILNIVSFGLMFFWVSRIVFTEVRNEMKYPMTPKQRSNFILFSSLCLLIIDLALGVTGIFTSPLTVLCAGFFLILWLVSILMDKLIIEGTFLRYFFKYLTLIIIFVILFDSVFYFLTKSS